MSDASLCDHTGCRRLGKRYVIQSPAIETGKIVVDLCDQHDRPIRVVEEIARGAKKKVRRQRGAVGVDYLSTLIERD